MHTKPIDLVSLIGRPLLEAQEEYNYLHVVEEHWLIHTPYDVILKVDEKGIITNAAYA